MTAQRPTYPPHVRELSPAEDRYLIDPPYVWNDMLIDTSKFNNISIDNLSPEYPLKHTRASLSQLDNLSTEIICAILENTDLLTITRLRATNTKLRGIINDWEPFREISRGAPDVLRVLLATKATVCGECGTFLQLLKLVRCCFRCLASDRRLLSVTISYVQITMGVDTSILQHIPHLTTIPRAKFWGIKREIPSYCAINYKAALKYVRPYPARVLNGEFEPYITELPIIIRRRRQKAEGPH
jgi:hypothetical protein